MPAAIGLAHVIPDLELSDVLVFWGQPPTSAGRNRPNKRWRRLVQRTNAPPTSTTQLLTVWTATYGAPIAGQRLWVMLQVIQPNGSSRSAPVIATCIVT